MNVTTKILLTLCVAATCKLNVGRAAAPVRELIYAQVSDVPLALDLHLPEATAPDSGYPTIIWVHGGAWRSGSKESVPIQELVERGYVIASVNYRLSPVAKFPAQIHDIKAAIRFLRANAIDLKLDQRKMIVAGVSAGAHLAALVGVTNGHAELEGAVGEHLQVDSSVAAIVSFFGASNLRSILSQSTPYGLNMRVPALELLLGGDPESRADLARLASPVEHVSADDPPLLLIHGDQDPQMPIQQSHELHGKYKGVKRPVQFEVVHGGKHGGDEHYTPAMLELVAKFLEQHLASVPRK
ncbi:MAG: alpha/beta hydrolase [Planctomycetota bacterium]|nr:alpha/beta hydrolase [Planctomycetota bacterium]MDA1178802.1 alpha/beta hydrolase [Planctomycetota bacterium]